MTRKDAAMLMSRLAGAYIGVTVGADTAEVFYGSCFESLDPELGLQVVERIVATDDKFPRPARFNEVRRAIERARQEPHRAIAEAPITDEERENVRQIIGEIRRTMEATRLERKGRRTPPRQRSEGRPR